MYGPRSNRFHHPGHAEHRTQIRVRHPQVHPIERHPFLAPKLRPDLSRTETPGRPGPDHPRPRLGIGPKVPEVRPFLPRPGAPARMAGRTAPHAAAPQRIPPQTVFRPPRSARGIRPPPPGFPARTGGISRRPSGNRTPGQRTECRLPRFPVLDADAQLRHFPDPRRDRMEQISDRNAAFRLKAREFQPEKPPPAMTTINQQAWFDSILRDPETRQSLARHGDTLVRSDGKSYPISDGIPSLVFPESLGGEDGRWNRFYDNLAPFYDLIQRILGPIVVPGSNPEKGWRD